mgnify:CR=1 FL=1
MDNDVDTYNLKIAYSLPEVEHDPMFVPFYLNSVELKVKCYIFW